MPSTPPTHSSWCCVAERATPPSSRCAPGCRCAGPSTAAAAPAPSVSVANSSRNDSRVVSGEVSRAIVASCVGRGSSPLTITAYAICPESISCAASVMPLTKPRHALVRSKLSALDGSDRFEWMRDATEGSRNVRVTDVLMSRPTFPGVDPRLGQRLGTGGRRGVVERHPLVPPAALVHPGHAGQQPPRQAQPLQGRRQALVEHRRRHHDRRLDADDREQRDITVAERRVACHRLSSSTGAEVARAGGGAGRRVRRAGSRLGCVRIGPAPPRRAPGAPRRPRARRSGPRPRRARRRRTRSPGPRAGTSARRARW